MSIRGPVTTAAKYATKYGPHAVVAWGVVGDQAKAALQKQVAMRQARRAAVDKARSVVDGSVLRVPHAGEPVFVVFSGDRPIDRHPPGEPGVEELVVDADLGRRFSPEEYDADRARERARRRLTRRRRDE